MATAETPSRQLRICPAKIHYMQSNLWSPIFVVLSCGGVFCLYLVLKTSFYTAVRTFFPELFQRGFKCECRCSQMLLHAISWTSSASLIEYRVLPLWEHIREISERFKVSGWALDPDASPRQDVLEMLLLWRTRLTWTISCWVLHMWKANFGRNFPDIFRSQKQL